MKRGEVGGLFWEEELGYLVELLVMWCGGNERKGCKGGGVVKMLWDVCDGRMFV